MQLNAARLIGPAVAGVLIGAIGTGWVFALNAVSFTVVLAGLLSIRPRAREARAGARPPVNFPTTLALFAGRVFDVGSAGLGVMNTALAIGTVAGTIAATRGVSPRGRNCRDRRAAVRRLRGAGGGHASGDARTAVSLVKAARGRDPGEVGGALEHQPEAVKRDLGHIMKLIVQLQIRANGGRSASPLEDALLSGGGESSVEGGETWRCTTVKIITSYGKRRSTFR
ncbi:MFS transporter [Streptomyces sp. NPDC002623]